MNSQIINIQMHNVTDVTDLQEINFKFQDGDSFVEDERRSQNLKKIMQPIQNQPKLPNDYQIDMQDTLKDLSGQDLSGDQGVLKYLIKEGIYDDPQVHQKSIIKIKYELRLPDGKLKDPAKTRNNVHRISLNSSNPIIKGLKMAFFSMKTGEVSWFSFSGAYNYSDEDANIEHEALTLYYKIEMVEHSDPKIMINNCCQEDRLRNLQNIREIGLEAFNKSNYDKAIKTYQSGINYSSTWPKNLQDATVMKEVKTFKLIYQSNLAQCYMQTQKLTPAIEILNRIRTESRNSIIEIKTLYRLAKCYFKQSEFEQSLTILRDLKDLCLLTKEEEADVKLLQNQCNNNIDKEIIQTQRKMKKIKKTI